MTVLVQFQRPDTDRFRQSSLQNLETFTHRAGSNTTTARVVARTLMPATGSLYGPVRDDSIYCRALHLLYVRLGSSPSQTAMITRPLLPMTASHLCFAVNCRSRHAQPSRLSATSSSDRQESLISCRTDHDTFRTGGCLYRFLPRAARGVWQHAHLR